jgi:hypothetical protein
VADIPGHCFLIVGYNDDTQMFIVKNSHGEPGPISVAYQNDRKFGSIIGASFIRSVADPTYVQSHANWLGKWYGTIAGSDYEIVIRRHHSFGMPGLPTNLGAARSTTADSLIFGSVSENGQSAEWNIETQNALGRGLNVTLHRNNNDPYLLQGETHEFFGEPQPVILSRFRQRYAAVWEPNDGHGWQGQHGLASVDYQSFFDRVTADGYRPLAVQGSPIGLGSEISSVWSQSPSNGWLASHGQTSDEYQRSFDQNCAEGWRLVDVSGYSEYGQARYASLWERADGRGWKARHGMDGREFQVAFDEALSQGFVVRKVSGYRVGIERRFVAIWEYAPTETCAVRHGITSQEVTTLTRDFAASGMHLSWLSGYPDTGRARFSAVWNTNVPETQFVIDLNGAEYQAEFDRLSQSGMRLCCISGYGAGI